MDISYIMGIMSIIIFLYRLVYLLIPMLLKGIKEKDNKSIFNSFTMLV